MGQPILVRGIQATVDAYRMNGVGPFAVWCGKMILFSSSDVENDDVDTGAEELKQFLTLMESSGSEGKFVLQMYKLKEDEEIDSGTKMFRGFPFSLWTAEGSMQPYAKLKNERMDQVLARMDAIEQRLIDRELVAEEEDQGAMGKIGKVLNGLMDMPQVRDAIGQWAGGMVAKMTAGGRPNLGKVAGLEAAQPEGPVLTEDQAQKAQAAINVLATKDPKLGDHLSAIARIAQQDPGRYNFLVGMLK